MMTFDQEVTYTKENWKDQYKDHRWYRVRDKILQRDDYRCKSCGSDRNLNVHHRMYEYANYETREYKKVWDTDASLLETLCQSCNEYEKRNNSVKYRLTKWLNVDFLSDGLGYLEKGMERLSQFNYSPPMMIQLARGICVALSSAHYHKMLFDLGKKQYLLGQESSQLPLNDQVIIADEEPCHV